MRICKRWLLLFLSAAGFITMGTVLVYAVREKQVDLRDDLIIRSVTAYEGPYIEDGTGDEVVDVAAVILENVSNTLYRNIQINVKTAEASFWFYIDVIPPGTRVVALDQSRTLWRRQPIIDTSVQAQVSIAQSTDALRIRPVGSTRLEITNTSSRPLTNISMFHKGYLAEPGFYMGGISYETTVSFLGPGESCVVSPACYSDGYSKIVLITYDEKALFQF